MQPKQACWITAINPYGCSGTAPASWQSIYSTCCTADWCHIFCKAPWQTTYLTQAYRCCAVGLGPGPTYLIPEQHTHPAVPRQTPRQKKPLRLALFQHRTTKHSQQCASLSTPNKATGHSMRQRQAPHTPDTQPTNTSGSTTSTGRLHCTVQQHAGLVHWGPTLCWHFMHEAHLKQRPMCSMEHAAAR